MTATDELRRMLDERGVEWHGDIATYWGGADAVESLFADNALDVSLYAVSPEQAIEATLGRGTCRIVKTWSDSDYVDGWRYRCSECMCFIPVNERDPETGDVISAANFCPNCGRRCVG